MHKTTTATAQPPAADPYRALLDVNVTQQPPCAYSLLGLQLSEANAETIGSAASRKRSVLHTRRQKANSRQWQLISAQLEQAIVTLTDESRKKEYDRQLAEKGLAEAPLTDSGPTVAVEEERPVRDSSDFRGKDEVQCRSCGTFGKPGCKYCGNCGDPLWEPCPKCGAMESSSQKFCGNCGINRPEAVDALLTQCISNLEQANRMRKRGEFEAAVTLLSQVSDEKHSLVIPYAQEAKALLDEVVVDRERRTAAAFEALAAAEASLAANDFDTARCALESIPPAIRTEEMERRLLEIQTVSEEATSLNFAIRKGLYRKEYDGMLEQVARLLELQPSRTDMQKLHAQLKRRSHKTRKKQLAGLYQQAKKKIAASDYADAVELLEGVSISTENDELQQLYELAKELFWLKDDLRLSPVTDPALVEIAKRLSKLRPADKGAEDLLKELLRRVSTPPEDPLAAYHCWAKPTESQQLGSPVQLLGWSRAINSSGAPDSTRRTIAEFPGRLQTACGLALQGLGQASVLTNLLPQDGGVLSRFTSRMRKAKCPTAWGIDIGSSVLKAVQLGISEVDQSVHLLDGIVIPHEKNLRKTDVNGEWSAIVNRTLKILSEEHDLSAGRLCVGFPGSRVLSRFIQLPPIPEKKLQEAIQYEARHQIPFDLNSLVWNSHVIRERQDDSESDLSRNVVLIAAKTGQLREYVEPFQDLGLPVALLQCDSVALHNFLVHEFYSEGRAAQPEHEDTLPVTAAIDIGSHSSSIVLSGPEMVWFRSVDQGSDQFTSSLIKEFKLTHDAADKLKCNPTASRSVSQWDEALRPAMKDLLKEIRLSLGAYESDHKQKPIAHILGLGGGFHMHGLLRFFNSIDAVSL